jgi:hypothetical protein
MDKKGRELIGCSWTKPAWVVTRLRISNKAIPWNYIRVGGVDYPTVLLVMPTEVVTVR